MQVFFLSIHVEGMLECNSVIEAKVEFRDPEKVVEGLGGVSKAEYDEACDRAVTAEALAKEALTRAEEAEKALAALKAKTPKT